MKNKIIIDIYPFGHRDFWKLIFLPLVVFDILLVAVLMTLTKLL